MPTVSTSSSRPPEERLLRIPLSKLHPHPANPNVMTDERFAALTRNIEREGRYPPIIVREHPNLAGEFQLLDGFWRTKALATLGHTDALCYLWPCSNQTALLILATVNRLHGEDVPAKRADLLAELAALLPIDALATLLPEDSSAIRDLLAFRDLDSEALLRQLTAAAADRSDVSPRACSFALLPADEAVVEEAVSLATATLSGPNRRGRALAQICRDYLEAHGA